MLCYRCGSHVPDGQESCGACGQKFALGLKPGPIAGFGTGTRRHRIAVETSPYKVGDILADRYEIKDHVGSGPTGWTYKCRDREKEQEVALKLVGTSVVITEADKDALVQSIRLARSLEHPNIVPLIDDGEIDGRFFFTMQHLEGLTLRRVWDLRRQKGQLFSLKEVEPVITQVAQALTYALPTMSHGCLKPDNIIVLPDLVKVTDFGLAISLPRAPFMAAQKAGGVNRFLAPEFPRGQPITARSDVFGLGVVFGEMLAGAPFDGPGFDLITRNPSLSKEIDAIFRKATSPNPDDRFGTPEEFVSAVANASEEASFLRFLQGPPSLPPQEARDAFTPTTREMTQEIGDDAIVVERYDNRDERTEPFIVMPSRDETRPDMRRFEPTPVAARVDEPTPSITTAEPLGRPFTDLDPGPEPTPTPLSSPFRVEPVSVFPPPRIASVSPAAERKPPAPPLPKRARSTTAPNFVAVLLVLAIMAVTLFLTTSDQRPDGDRPSAAAAPSAPTTTTPAAEASAALVADPPATAPPSTDEPADPGHLNAPLSAEERVAQAESRHRAEEEREQRRRQEEAAFQRLADVRPASPHTTASIAGHGLDGVAAAANDTRGGAPLPSTPQATAQDPDASLPSVSPQCGAGMRFIPAGKLKFGAPDSDDLKNFGDLNAEEIALQGFCIDILEFPNRQGEQPKFANWNVAHADCAQHGKRLCHEEEWERACKGPSNLRFPYGRNFDPEACNTANHDQEGREVSASGSFPHCLSGFGIADLSGNLAEWTDTRADAGPNYIVKGGSAERPDYDTRCSARTKSPAGLKDARERMLGFRCCANPK